MPHLGIKNEALGAAIKKLRKLKGATQAEMAPLLGVAASTYGLKEYRGEFSEAEIRKIASRFKVAPEPYIDLYNNFIIEVPAGEKDFRAATIRTEAIGMVTLRALSYLLQTVPKYKGFTIEKILQELTMAVGEEALNLAKKV